MTRPRSEKATTADRGPRVRGSSGGYSLTELLIVVVIVGVLTAIALPSLTGSRRAVGEQAVKVRLLDLAARQEAYRSALGYRRYGERSHLESVRLPDGRRLLSESDMSLEGWRITLAANAAAFTFRASPIEGNASPRQYCISEDGALRQGPRDGDCERANGER